MRGEAAFDNRLWTPAFIMLLGIDAAMQMGMYFTRPIISSYAVMLGASLTLASLLGGLNATVAMAMRPAAGVLADALGKKPLMIGSCALFVLSGFGCAIASSTIELTVSCIVQGIAFAIRSTVMTGMVALVVPKTKVATGIGLMGVSYTAGAALGPLIGAHIGSLAGYPTTFAAAGILYGIGMILAGFFKIPNSPENTQGERIVLPRIRISSLGSFFYAPAAPLALIAGLVMVAHGSMNALAILLNDLGALEGATLYFAVYALISVAAKPLAGKAADKAGLDFIALPCMLVAASGMALLALDRSMLFTVVAAICMGAGQASVYSAMQAEAIRRAPASEVGRATSTFFIGPDLGMGLGPIASGFILGKWGVEAMFLFAASSILCAAVIYVLWRKIDGGKVEHALDQA